MSAMKPAARAAALLVLLLAGNSAWSLSPYDPNDRLYTLLSAWEEKGYYEPLPMLRPYSPQLIQSCLNQVIEKGAGLDRDLARKYLSELDGGQSLMALKPADGDSLVIGLDSSLEGFTTLAQQNSFLRPGLELSASGGFGSLVRYSVMTGLWLHDKDESDFIPYRTEGRLFYKNGGGASVHIGGTTFMLPSTWKGGVFLGTDSLSFQAGLMKSSFGPFFETSAVLGPQAPEAGQFALTYQGGWFGMSSVLLELNAGSTVVAPVFFPSKYLILHSASIIPFSWLSLGLMQSTVFGARVDPLYLVPFGVLTDSQIWQGDWDNSLMGLFARARLPLNILLNFSLYIDDLNSNEAVKLSFDSGQDKVALHAGVVWTPELPVLLRLSAEYLMITPYMYTHSRFAILDYLNYTTFDRNLGSVLDPNSDQLIARAQVQPTSWLQGELWLRISRHGNGSDHGSGSVAGDGSIWDDGYASDRTVTFYGPSTFLTQKVLEESFQAGVSAEVDLVLAPFTTSLRGEYTFEIVRNKGLVEGPDSVNHYLKLTLRVGL
jgi:hypothetical protein